MGEKAGMAVDAGKMASGPADAVFAMLHVPLMSRWTESGADEAVSRVLPGNGEGGSVEFLWP